MGFGESAKKWVAEALFFVSLSGNDAPLLPLSFDRFPPNFPRTRVQVVARSQYMVSYSRKVSIKGSNFLKNRLLQGTLGYPVCAQPTSHGKCSATPKLFPSPCGHPTDLSFLGDFCRGMYRFPAIHVRMFPFATLSAMAK